MTFIKLTWDIVLSKFSILSFHRISLNKETYNRQTQFKPMVQFISKINRNVGNFGRNFVWIFSKIWITLLCVIIFWNYLSRSSKKNLSFLIRSIDRYEGINDLIVWKIIRIYIYIYNLFIKSCQIFSFIDPVKTSKRNRSRKIFPILFSKYYTFLLVLGR